MFGWQLYEKELIEKEVHEKERLHKSTTVLKGNVQDV